MLSPIFDVAIINGIVFSIQNFSKNFFYDPNTYFASAITGGIADCTQAFICLPAELIKTRSQIKGIGKQRKLFILLTHSYKEPIDCLKKSYKRRGIQHEIMRGLSMTFARNIPSFAAYFPA